MSIALKFNNTFAGKSTCTGCETCSQICAHHAITFHEDNEGFRYPKVNQDLCTECGICEKICPIDNPVSKYKVINKAYGGYIKDDEIRKHSTSGGAFSAIVDSWCDKNYVIFGASTDGISVTHDFIEDKQFLDKFRKSKYSQSNIQNSYIKAKDFLKEGKKVVFSGTPCQIAGLRSYLKDKEYNGNLLTIEVICEGVPSPLYIRKMEESYERKGKGKIVHIDYRYKDKNKWDFQVMKIKTLFSSLQNPIYKTFKYDRWFNPFWSIWLQHLMSRPSCYSCPFTTNDRVADITLGDLWGVHIYCPELYGNNGGASLIICNTNRGLEALTKAKELMFGHDLDFVTALRYQGPLRKHIDYNEKRPDFIYDLCSHMSFEEINKKWAIRPSFSLLWHKYVWGNRQNVWWWKVKNHLKI